MMNLEKDEPVDQDILDKIQEVEMKVWQMSVQAMAERIQIIQEAKNRAECFLKERHQEVKQASALLLQEGMKAAEQEAFAIIEKARQEAQEMNDRAMARMDEAVDLVLQMILPGLSLDAKP